MRADTCRRRTTCSTSDLEVGRGEGRHRRARHAEQLVQQPGDALQLGERDAAELDRHLRIVEPLGQDLQERLHGDERIADLVGELGREGADGREPRRLLQHAARLVEHRRHLQPLRHEHEMIGERRDARRRPRAS